MIRKKRSSVLLFLGMALLPACSSGMFAGVGNSLENLWPALRDLLVNLCGLGEQDLGVLTRLAITVVAFIIPFIFISRIQGGGGSVLSFSSSSGGGASRALGAIIAVFVAFSVFLFIPQSVILFVGTSYASIVAWVLLSAPLVGGFYLWSRWRGHLGNFHWVLLLAIGIILLALYGYGFKNMSSVGVC